MVLLLTGLPAPHIPERQACMPFLDCMHSLPKTNTVHQPSGGEHWSRQHNLMPANGNFQHSLTLLNLYLIRQLSCHFLFYFIGVIVPVIAKEQVLSCIIDLSPIRQGQSHCSVVCRMLPESTLGHISRGKKLKCLQHFCSLSYCTLWML